MGHHAHHIEIKQEQFTVPSKGKNFAFGAMAIGLILTVIGIFTLPSSNDHHADKKAPTKTEANANAGHTEGHDAKHASVEAHGDSHAAASAESHEDHHEKPWYLRILLNVFINGYLLLLISLAALFFVALQYIANAGWSVLIKRIPEAMYTFIPVAFIIVMVVLVFAKNDMYHWAHYEHLHLKKGDAGYDPILAGKSPFLNSIWLFGATTLLVVVWYLFGRKLSSLSSAEDAAQPGDNSFFKKSIKVSAIFTVIYGFCLSFLAWLFVMSIDAHWFSTIFGVYNFATGFVTALTIIAIIVTFLRSQGYLKLVTDEHVHDVAKFMFAFSIFWTYIWLSQYLLIWYAHIPEEMMYYKIRFEEYKFYFFLNVILNFICPFLILMMRNAKRSPKVIAVIGAILIFGHFNDVWLMVMPGVYGKGMDIGLLEIGMLIFFVGVFAYWVLKALTKKGLVPVNHPYVEESAYHDVGP